ncbi:MAG: hypothetical protein EXS05_23030 [Planctomycetaceae bacterium]|nr:hypothetical protein [Planctomycetaceae bacterium]
MRRSIQIALVVLIATWVSDARAGRWKRAYCRTQCSCACPQAVYICPLPTCACPMPAVAAVQPPSQQSYFISPKGRRYRFYDSTEVPLREDERELEADSLNEFRADRAERSAGGENFAGHDRKVAKTSVAGAPVENFSDLRRVLDSLPSDDDMLNHDPEITREPDSDRVDEEMRNVRVTAYIYAAKREPDNDFHLILGRGPSETVGRNMMTAEVTGLPRTGPFRAQMKTARDEFKAFFGPQHLPSASYRVFVDPIRVRVKGSLFYDVDHAPGIVGTGDYKPETSWEIHPVTKIEFLE